MRRIFALAERISPEFADKLAVGMVVGISIVFIVAGYGLILLAGEWWHTGWLRDLIDWIAS